MGYGCFIGMSGREKMEKDKLGRLDCNYLHKSHIIVLPSKEMCSFRRRYAIFFCVLTVFMEMPICVAISSLDIPCMAKLKICLH